MIQMPALPDDYPALLERLKRDIASARTRAALAVNAELIELYWRIGKEILERQGRQGWGAKIIDQLAVDLRHEFPEMKGLSARNLKYMRALAAAWPEQQIVSQPVAQLPWGHICRLLDKLDDPASQLWYAQSAVEHGWSRKVLEHHIATGRYGREGKAGRKSAPHRRARVGRKESPDRDACQGRRGHWPRVHDRYRAGRQRAEARRQGRQGPHGSHIRGRFIAGSHPADPNFEEI